MVVRCHVAVVRKCMSKTAYFMAYFVNINILNHLFTNLIKCFCAHYWHDLYWHVEFIKYASPEVVRQKSVVVRRTTAQYLGHASGHLCYHLCSFVFPCA